MMVSDRKRDKIGMPMAEFDNVGGRKDAYRMIVKQINWEATQFERKKKYYTDLINSQNSEISDLEKSLYDREITATAYNAKNYASMAPNNFGTSLAQNFYKPGGNSGPNNAQGGTQETAKFGYNSGKAPGHGQDQYGINAYHQQVSTAQMASNNKYPGGSVYTNTAIPSGRNSAFGKLEQS